MKLYINHRKYKNSAKQTNVGIFQIKIPISREEVGYSHTKSSVVLTQDMTGILISYKIFLLCPSLLTILF
jgi:hypothetical protein